MIKKELVPLIAVILLYCFTSCSNDDKSPLDCDEVSLEFQDAQSTFLSNSTTSNCNNYLNLMIMNQDDCGVLNTHPISFYTEQCPCMDIYQEIIRTVMEWSDDPNNNSKCEAYKAAMKVAIDTPNCDEDGDYLYSYENLEC